MTIRPPDHTCHATGCNRHARLLAGHVDAPHGKDPSEEYIRVATAAVKWLEDHTA